MISFEPGGYRLLHHVLDWWAVDDGGSISFGCGLRRRPESGVAEPRGGERDGALRNPGLRGPASRRRGQRQRIRGRRFPAEPLT